MRLPWLQGTAPRHSIAKEGAMTPEQRIAQLTAKHARECLSCLKHRFTRPVRQFPGMSQWVSIDTCGPCRLALQDPQWSILVTTAEHHRRPEVRAWAREATEYV